MDTLPEAPMPSEHSVESPQAMEALGAHLALVLAPGSVVFFHGNLGAGKTTLVRGILRGFGYNGAVKSPTYTLVEPYELAEHRVYHFDLYRLNDPQELELMGIRDYLGARGICLVEWAERGAGVLPEPDVVITIESVGTRRMVRMTTGPMTNHTALHGMA